MKKISIIILLFPALVSAQGWYYSHVEVGASGQNFSDDFNRTDADPPSGNWAEITGGGTSWAIETNQMAQNALGSVNYAISYTTPCNTVTQYVCVLLVNGEGGALFRYTGTANDGYYTVYAYGGDGNLYWSFNNHTGWVADIGSGAAFEPGNNNYVGMTIQGTGSGTIVKIWDLGTTPGRFTPTNKDNWETASDAADVTLTDDPGGSAADTGLRVGIGTFNNNAAHNYDNWTGGDTN